MTGFQAIAGGVAQPYEAPFDGKIVAWSITLAKPSTHGHRRRPPTRSASSTNSSARPRRRGSASCARSKARKPPKYTLVRQSPLEVLNPYFGSTPIFALEHPLTVLQGQVVALTVPTWAPMFAFNVSAENTWRGSRLPEHCASKEDIQGGHPQQGVGKTKTYGCYYSNARLLYTATLVKQPSPERDRRLPGQSADLAQAAVRAVADVEADQLVAAAAGAQVLRGARQGGGRGGQRQDHRHRLHLLAGLAVDVDRARLGVGERLAAGGRGAHPVELLLVHRRED